MPLDQIESLLKEIIGLDPQSVGSRLIGASVRRRIAKLGLSDQTEYLALLQSSEEELEELIELTVVPETWFFRDRNPFSHLMDLVRRQRSHYSGARPLRVLSAPCSSGEEPYSIAISLLEAGLRSGEFVIDAADISRRALEKAASGIYGKNSFRYKEHHILEKYIVKEGNDFVVDSLVTKKVNFMHCNLIEDYWKGLQGPYDVIFCRNLLIYLNHTAKVRLLDHLEVLLAKEGVLYIGHAETLQFLKKTFKGLSPPGAFAYSRRVVKDKEKSEPGYIQSKVRKTGTGRSARRVSFEKKAPRTPVTESPSVTAGIDRPLNMPPPIRQAQQLIEKAKEKADRGKLDEAARLCENFLEQKGPHAEAFYLLGLIAESRQRGELAEKYYRKSIYLEPGYSEALLQLALLMESRQETKKAELLRRRAGKTRSILQEQGS